MPLMKKSIPLSFGMVWAVCVFAATRVGLLGSELDPGTIAFAMLIGTLFYMRVGRRVYGFIALCFLLITPFLYVIGLNVLSQNSAIVAFWFLVAALLAGIKEMYTEYATK